MAKTKLQSVGSDSGANVVTRHSGPDLLNVVVDGNPVDLVENFTYLGSIQTSDRYCRSDITRRIGLTSSAMSSLSNIWNTKHLSIQMKVRVYQTLVLSILLHASKTWTSPTSDMRAIKSFHKKCQRRILGIRWHDFIRNCEVSLRTGLAPVSDRITRGRNAIFGHVARLPLQHTRPFYSTPSRAIGWSIPRPFPLRLCGGKPLVAVTRERCYSPSQLRVNNNDDDAVGLRHFQQDAENKPISQVQGPAILK